MKLVKLIDYNDRLTPENDAVVEEKPKLIRGFAAMDPEKRRAIAAAGGKAVNPANRAFSRNPGLAAEAGRKGGERGHGGGRPKETEND